MVSVLLNLSRLGLYPQLLLLSSAASQLVGGWIRQLMAEQQGNKEVGTLVRYSANCKATVISGLCICKP